MVHIALGVGFGRRHLYIITGSTNQAGQPKIRLNNNPQKACLQTATAACSGA
jgi:hypothetical protein